MNPLPDAHWQATTPPFPGAARPSAAASDTAHGELPSPVKDGNSLLVDAAEEVGLHLSENIERRSHAERRVSAGRPARLMTLEQINAYLEKARKPLDPQEMALQVRRLIREASMRSQLAGAWEGAFGRPTEKYLLLQSALQTARSEGAGKATLDRLEAAIAQIEAEAGSQVFADLATIDEAALYSESAHDVQRFQDSIHAVLRRPTLVQAFQEALSLADQNGRRLDSAILHLMQALGTCFTAPGLAREKALLEALLSELFHLKYLNTLFESTQALVRGLRRRQARGSPRKEYEDEAGQR